MEKESVKKFDLEAAFKALDEIEIPVAEKGIKANRVDLKERFNQKSAHETLIEDYYDVSSHEDLEEAQDERDAEVAQAKLARIEKIVDLDAESADDLLPSYVGKVIIQCPQCMTLFYKNQEDIEHSDENPGVVNINEVCQHCGNASGYTLIGKVGAVEEGEADQYTEEPAGEESELDLDFEEPTEEVDAEGTGEGAEEMSDEELSDDELAELDLDLEEVEEEEEKKEESLNLSKETSENETEHKSENLTLNENVDNINEDTDIKDLSNAQKHEVMVDVAKSLANKDVNTVTAGITREQGGIAYENEKVKDIKKAIFGESLTEEVDKNLDAKLKAHNDYIAYLQQMIKQEEEALKKAENDEIKAAIQRRLDAFTQDLHDALPDVLKDEPEANEVATEEPVEEMPTEAQAEEEPKTDEQVEEEAPVEEQLTEDAAEEEKSAEDGNEIDYVDYKHSYCHVLEPKLKAINYLVHVKKVEPKILKGYILKLLKDPEVRWTEKEKEFKKNIEEKDDAYDILNYVKNSIEKAKTIKVKVDADGELVEGLNEGFEGCLYEVLTESLNKSEAAVSENETENKSENLTLNESSDAEIDAIISSWGDDAEVEEGYTGNPAERTTHLEYTDDDPTDGKAVLPDNIEKQLTEGEECKDGECEKPLEECGEKPLKEEDEVPTEEPAPVEEPVEGEPNAEEEKEELPNVDFNTEEVKEVAQEAVEEVIKEAEAEVEPEVVEEKVEEVVADAVEEKVESEEAPVEGEEIPAEEPKDEAPVDESLTEASEAGLDELLTDPEFKEDIPEAETAADLKAESLEECGDNCKEKPFEECVEELNEDSFNMHINDFLSEVYANVKSFETTSCQLKENKLIVEGQINFNSGNKKVTVFEFLPAYGDGKLFLEGYNKDFSDEKAFTVECRINEEKELITEQICYKFKINETLVEGLK